MKKIIVLVLSLMVGSTSLLCVEPTPCCNEKLENQREKARTWLKKVAHTFVDEFFDGTVCASDSQTNQVTLPQSLRCAVLAHFCAVYAKNLGLKEVQPGSHDYDVAADATSLLKAFAGEAWAYESLCTFHCGENETLSAYLKSNNIVTTVESLETILTIQDKTDADKVHCQELLAQLIVNFKEMSNLCMSAEMRKVSQSIVKCITEFKNFVQVRGYPNGEDCVLLLRKLAQGMVHVYGKKIQDIAYIIGNVGSLEIDNAINEIFTFQSIANDLLAAYNEIINRMPDGKAKEMTTALLRFVVCELAACA